MKLKDEGFTFFHFMIDLNQGPCVIKRITGCGAGNEYLAITPSGDIYQMCIRDRFYACKQIKEKGLLYGLLEGLLYIVFLIVLVFLAKENFSFEISMLYSVILTTVAGGIGGIIGVNF